MLNMPFRWEEITPKGTGGMEASETSLTYTDFQKTLNIFCDTSDVKKILLYVLGYAKVGGGPNNTNSTWRLSRKLPAQHPRYQWLRATRVTSLKGIQGVSKLRKDGRGTWGDYKQAMMTIQFEAPTYPMLSDEDIYDSESGTYKEYRRFVTKNFDSNIEQISRKGENMSFLHPNAILITPTFTGDVIVKQPKGVLKWTWHRVPEDWIMLGKLIPTNLMQCTGCVNLDYFPTIAYPDRNDPTGARVVQCPPGTLLFMPPKLTPSSSIDPDVMNAVRHNPALDEFLPRCYDVELQMIYFNPPNEENKLVRCATYGGGELRVIRGHNLFPLPKTSNTGFRWYAATRGPVAFPVESDQQLIYQYYDFERVFSWARSF